MGSLNSFPQARGSAWESTDRPGPDAPCLPVVLALVCGQPQPLPVFAQVVSWEHGPALSSLLTCLKLSPSGWRAAMTTPQGSDL